MADDPKWMEHAAEKMKRKGTLGSFGKATPKKIAAGKKEGGKQAKKAIFAQNAKKASHKHGGEKK
jgi:hypothetical protein